MIEVQKLNKNYGERQAIKDLNFKIEKGDVVGFLGPNGAGKSTTMKIITGFMAPTSGLAKVCGFDVFESPLEVKKRIGYLPETPPLYTDMTVEDYLFFVAQLKNVEKLKVNNFVNKALDKTQLTDNRKRLIRNLSKGFKQRVGIAQALVSDPEVLVLDEPTVGLDPKQVTEIRNLIRELKGEHTIILSTHILPKVQATCNKVIIIHEGRIVAQDSIEKIEKLHQRTLTIELRTLKNIENIVALKKIEGVLDFIESSPLHYNISADDKLETISRISKFIVESGYGLVELTPSHGSLEDVFLKLTYGQDEKI